MKRRELIGALGAAAVASTAGRAMAQDPHDHDHDHGQEHGDHDGHMRVMVECALHCNQVAAHCLEAISEQKGDPAAHVKVHQSAMDCQEFCGLTIGLMARESPLAKFAHMANAEACAACAKACEAHPEPDEIVKACLKSCRECEEVCRAASGGEHEHEHEHDDDK